MIVVVKRQTKKIIKIITLEDYELLEDPNTNLRPQSHSTTSSNEIFTFWSNPWKEKFILKPYQDKNEYITLAAHNFEIKANWIAAIKEHQKLTCLDRLFKSTNQNYGRIHNNYHEFLAQENINFDDVEVQNQVTENNKKYEYKFGIIRSNDTFRPNYCDATKLVLPGLYCHAYRVVNILANKMIPNFNLSWSGCLKFHTETQDENLYLNRNMVKISNREMIQNFAPNISNPTTPGTPLANNHNISNSSLNLSTDNNTHNTSHNNNNHPEDNLENLRLDDFDFYFPRATRNDFHLYLPKNKWKNGAFIIRYSSKKVPPQFCITVIYNKSGPPTSTKDHVRHILINFKGNEHRMEYFINKAEESDCKFSSILELISYYMKNSLQPHFIELNTKLIDVFMDEGYQSSCSRISILNQSIIDENQICYEDPAVTDLENNFHQSNFNISGSVPNTSTTTQHHRHTNLRGSSSTVTHSMSHTRNSANIFSQSEMIKNQHNKVAHRHTSFNYHSGGDSSPSKLNIISSEVSDGRSVSPLVPNRIRSSNNTSGSASRLHRLSKDGGLTSEVIETVSPSRHKSQTLPPIPPSVSPRQPQLPNFPPPVDTSIWSVSRLQRKHGGFYEVTGYVEGCFVWDARNNNEYSVAIDQLFAVVGETQQDWIPVVPVDDKDSWYRTAMLESRIKRYVPEQYVRKLVKP